jgi:two-component system, NarL family, nitrate/nitrite response regulator NarL
MRAISIVVADDHPAALHGITDVLASSSDMTVVAACSNGTAALRAICQLAPTVAVLDTIMPGLSGVDVVAGIHAERCATKVVLFAESASDDQLLTAIARGAKGIVFKGAALPTLVQCVRHVAAGGDWLPPDLIDAALEREAECQSDVAESLTSRERQIVLMVAGGLSNKDVGRRLELSEGTVKVHLHNVYKKLGINNRTALTAIAITDRKRVQRSGSAPRDDCGYRLLAMSNNVSEQSSYGRKLVTA